MGLWCGSGWLDSLQHTAYLLYHRATTWCAGRRLLWPRRCRHRDQWQYGHCQHHELVHQRWRLWDCLYSDIYHRFRRVIHLEELVKSIVLASYIGVVVVQTITTPLIS